MKRDMISISETLTRPYITRTKKLAYEQAKSSRQGQGSPGLRFNNLNSFDKHKTTILESTVYDIKFLSVKKPQTQTAFDKHHCKKSKMSQVVFHISA